MERKKNIKILLASMKKLLILKILPKAASILYFGFASPSLADFLQCPPIIGCRKNPGRFSCHRQLSELFSVPQAASGTILRVTGGFLYATTSSLKRVTELLHIIIVFSMSKLQIRFHKMQPKDLKPNSTHTESTDLIFKASKPDS